MGRRCFVSGGAGVIGQPLVNKLLSRGDSVIVGDLKPCPKDLQGKVQYLHMDLNDLPETLDVDLFFHLAATFERTEESLEFWEENFHHNVTLSHHLIERVPKKARVCFASSYLVYDPASYMRQNAEALKETSPILPRNLCGAAKLYHENELAFLKRSSISARIFRVYGKGSKDVVSRFKQAKEITLFGKEARFDYIFADDVADGLIRLAETDFTGAVNLGTGVGRQVQEVVDCIGNLKVHEIETQHPLENSFANITLLKNLTGWQPKITLEQGIKLL